MITGDPQKGERHRRWPTLPLPVALFLDLLSVPSSASTHWTNSSRIAEVLGRIEADYRFIEG